MSYLNHQGVPEYMQDALNQILQIRIRRQMPVTKYPTSPKEPINIAQFLGNYCKSISNGTHLFKSKNQDLALSIHILTSGEFEFITLTSRNRLQFLRLLEKSFALGLGDETLEISDFHSLIGTNHSISRTILSSIFKSLSVLIFLKRSAMILIR